MQYHELPENEKHIDRAIVELSDDGTGPKISILQLSEGGYGLRDSLFIDPTIEFAPITVEWRFDLLRELIESGVSITFVNSLETV